MKKPSRILIADQDEKGRNDLESILGLSGYETGSASTGHELLEMIKNAGANLCIIDPLLPDTDGFSLSKTISSTYPQTRVIITTSSKMDDHSRLEASIKYGAADFLMKPFNEQTVLKAVEAQISGKTPPPATKKETNLSKELDEMLENTLSGIDLFPAKKKRKNKSGTTAVFSTTKAPKPEVQGSTMRLNPEDLKREMARIKKEMKTPASQPEPQAKVEEVFTSNDIFGELIDDIEAGKVTEEEFTLPGKNQQKKDEVRSDTDADIFGTQPLPPMEPIPEEPEDLRSPGNQQSGANEYQFLEKIASGGMAEVWKAKLVGEKGFEKIVAIKKILPHLSANDDFLTMFTDEAKVAAKLTHPNIAQIYELRTQGQQAYIAMEYVSGHTLRQIFQQCKKLDMTMPVEVVFYIGMKLCNALYYAHNKKDFDNQELKIVHRDVSPQNIIISGEGEIKLVDFGIAKASIKATETVAGSLKGKLLYMSPEQGEGKPLDHRSDIFSLGCVLYEALTGERMFSGNSELAILKNVREALFPEPRTLNPEIPPEAEQVLMKVLAKMPEDRYESARVCENQFKDFLKNGKSHLNESDIADYIRFLFEGDLVKLEALGAKAKPAAPLPQAVPEPESLPEAPSFSGLTPPPVQAPVQQVAPPPVAAPQPRRVPLEKPKSTVETGSKAGRNLLVVFALILILAIVAWALYFRGSDQSPQEEPIREPAVETSQPSPGVNTPPVEEFPTPQPSPTLESGTAPGLAVEGETEAKKADEEMEKMREDFRKKKEELEKLKKNQ